LPIGWKKKAAQLPPLAATVVPAKRGDQLEIDELWSFVQKKANKHWIWLVVCRRTRQVIAAAMGARDVYTDFYATYFCVVPEKQHRPSEKGTGQTNNQTNKVERFNLTLRQRLGRFVRKTLSFSKSSRMHWYALLLFLHEYNCHCCERFKLTADPATST
jgi:IS1 family transposase